MRQPSFMFLPLPKPKKYYLPAGFVYRYERKGWRVQGRGRERGQAHLEHIVRLVATGRVRVKDAITHVLHGIESVRRAFEITANKGQHRAIHPVQVMMRA